MATSQLGGGNKTGTVESDERFQCPMGNKKVLDFEQCNIKAFESWFDICHRLLCHYNDATLICCHL